jgi:FkbM family methyltransferase
MGNTVQKLPRPLRRWVRRLRDLPTRFREWPEQRRQLGPRAARQLGWSAFRHPIGDPTDPSGPLDAVAIPGLAHPLWFRHGTSDVLAIRQVFVRHEYRWLHHLQNIQTIVDIGANIGAAAVAFLHQFPKARLIAVEPAAGNFAVLQQNLAPFADRAVAVHAAVWPTPARLQLHGGFRDSLDWSFQVRPAQDISAEPSVEGITIPQLLEQQRIDGIDLLKIDIEGAEGELFRGDTSWLTRVRHLCIELHDDDCRQAFEHALQPYPHACDTHDETTLCSLHKG